MKLVDKKIIFFGIKTNGKKILIRLIRNNLKIFLLL